jgi:hypothetical protein
MKLSDDVLSEVIPFFAVDIDYPLLFSCFKYSLCQDSPDVSETRAAENFQGLAKIVAGAEFSLVKSDARSDSKW